MKKRLYMLVAICSLFALGATGCAKREIDPARVRAAFQSAPDNIKATLEESLTDISANNYSGALPLLQKVAYGATLTRDQSDIIVDTITKVRAKIQESAK